MPLGEIVGEIILRPIIELFFYGVCYCIGSITLKICTLGTIRLAPLTSVYEKNRDKEKWHQMDWSIWLSRPMKGKVLKAECTCLVGLLVLVTIGVAIYFSI